MNYSKLQKFTSFFLIFFFLFGITFRLPFYSLLTNVFAGNKDYYNIVSILVNQDIYNSIQDEINTYANDIQNVLENTRAVIVPVPSNSNIFNLSSLNESLFFEGYKSVDNVNFESKLIGTILVGKLPLAILDDGGKKIKSIAPYVDFEDKAYIYDHKTKTYKKNSDAINNFKAEIWHGVISPNSGNKENDIKELKSYFKKNHSFYKGTGNFDKNIGVINGNINDIVPKEYEPFVFYFDNYREQQSLNLTAYSGYQAYLENREDLVYNNYSKKLAEKVKEKVKEGQNSEMKKLIDKISDEDLKKAFLTNTGIDLKNSNSTFNKQFIKSSTKKFLEIFNKGTISDFRTNVHNAGRYNKSGSDVNVDMIPYLVSILDVVSDEVEKAANNDITNKIESLVKNGISRNLALPIKIDIDLWDNPKFIYENDILNGIKNGEAGLIIPNEDKEGVKDLIDNLVSGDLSDKDFESKLSKLIDNLFQKNNDYIDLIKNITGDKIGSDFSNTSDNGVTISEKEDIVKLVNDILSNNDNITKEDKEKIKNIITDILGNLDNNSNNNSDINDDIKNIINTIFGFIKVKSVNADEIEDIINSIFVNSEVLLDKKEIELNKIINNILGKTNASDDTKAEVKKITNNILGENSNSKKVVGKGKISNQDKADLVKFINNLFLEDTNIDKTKKDDVLGLLNDIFFLDDIGGFGHRIVGCDKYTKHNSREYTNILYGKIANDIKNAKECSIYRGSNLSGGTLVEANRAFDFKLALEDEKKLKNDSQFCINGIADKSSLVGYWAGNTPLNIDKNSILSNNYRTNKSNYSKAIVPLFDLDGSVEINDSLKIPSPYQCYENNFIKKNEYNYSYNGNSWNINNLFSLPIEGQIANNWNCKTENKVYNFEEKISNNNNGFSNLISGIFGENKIDVDKKFIELYKNLDTKLGEKKELYLDYKKVDELINVGNFKKEDEIINKIVGKYYYNTPEEARYLTCGADKIYRFYFKKIPSYILHTSPTKKELLAQSKNPAMKSIPIDRVKYIDFISAIGKYVKIDLPNIFDFRKESGKNKTYEEIKNEMTSYLNENSEKINKLIEENNPKSLKGKDLEIYNLLKTGDYPKEGFDIKKYLEGNGDYLGYGNKGTVDLENEEKDFNYYDFVTFSAYWNSLNSVSAKYKFIFEHYLSDQVGGNDFNFILPKNKKLYEIAYLGAEGTTTDMYVKLDPEIKKEVAYSDIFSKNAKLDSIILGKKVISGGIGGGNGTGNLNGGNGIGNSLSSQDILSGNLLNNGKDVDVNNLDKINKNLSKIFKCSPPEGVPIWKWVGAVQCRLEDMLPPKIKINSGVCGEDLFNYSNFSNNKTSGSGNNKTSGSGDNKTSGSGDNKTSGSGDNKTSGSGNNKISETGNNKISETGNNKTSGTGNDKNKQNLGNDKLFLITNKLSENGLEVGENILHANDKVNIFLHNLKSGDLEKYKEKLNENSTGDKIVLSLGNKENKGLNFPLKISLKKSNGITIFSKNIAKFDDILGLLAIDKIGTYNIEIKDSNNNIVSKNIEIISGEPSSIDLNFGSTVLGTGGAISTNILYLYDKYGNTISGDFYDVNMEILGDSIKFKENNTKKLNFSTNNGYRIFRLVSTDEEKVSIIKINVTKGEKKYITTVSNNINVIKGVDINLKRNGDLKVGKNTYKFNLEVKDNSGNIIKNLNSRAYLVVDKKYGYLKNSYVNVKNGKAEIEFITSSLSGEKVLFEFQIEGINKIFRKYIDILPSKAVKVDLKLSKNKLEANPKKQATLYVELKDIYGNLVFNDNSTKVNIELLDKYKDKINIPEKSKVVVNGKTSFTITPSLIPGISYIKVSTEKSLSDNTVSIILNDKGKNKNLDVSGVGENAIKIETFDFWNVKDIIGKKYNSLYTVLLGASYGDFTKENYLASGILFDENNRGLIVTSLLNNPYSYNDVIEINPSGEVNDISSGGDLTQNLEKTLKFDENGHLYLEVYNNSLNVLVSKIYYNFGDNTKLNICENNYCKINNNETSINLKLESNDYSVEKKGNKLEIKNINGNIIFDIDNLGKIYKDNSISVNLVNGKVGQTFSINEGNKKIGELIFNFSGENVKYVTKNILKQDLRGLKNKILFTVETDDYFIRKEYNNSSTSKVVLFYSDIFSNNDSLNSFAKKNPFYFDNFSKQEGLGWKDGNKTLLSFAAGKNVGDSVKDYASISVINLGDPVVFLKPIRKTFSNTNILRNFDRTIGEKINNKEIKDFRVFDYNGDGRDDILIINEDKYLSLLENKQIAGKFLNQKNLAHIVDLGNTEFLNTGDFSGDNFDDIFFVNNKGIPFLLNNEKKDFVRVSLKDKLRLKGKVIGAKVFDMDADGYDDLIILDDSGEINIFYSDKNLNFTKKLVYSGFGIKLNGTSRSDMGAVYFDGLFQLENGKKDKNNIIDSSLVDKNIFEQFTYKLESEKNKKLIEDIDLENDLPIGNFDNKNPNNNSRKKLTTFIKSQYGENVGLKVEKKFSNNGGLLKGGDTVEVSVILKNITNSKLENIAYLENFPKYFTLDKNSIKTSKKLEIKPPKGSYKFLVDGFGLNSGEELKLTYTLKIKSFKFGYIEAGLFEKGELGDDKYGDILLKKNKQNCSQTNTIFRSIGVREYEVGTKEPTCNEKNMKVPDNITGLTKDLDGNGIPDYLDKITNEAKSDNGNPVGIIEKMKELAGDFFIKDSDNDGISDINDDAPNLGKLEFLEKKENSNKFITGDGLDFKLNFQKINNKIDSLSEGVDNLIKGFGCGFGGGGCISSPLNWAPLAPGSDPTFMGKHLGDGLRVDEGYPIFSTVTWRRIHGSCIPMFYPLGKSAPGCFMNGAGGALGTTSPTNNFRIFWTPTLTGGQGMAFCYGAPASVVGNIPPKGASPVVPGGNCIVVAAPLPNLCKDDGSDGDPASLGIPTYFDAFNGGVGGNGTGGNGTGGNGAGGNGAGGNGVGGVNPFGIINGNCLNFNIDNDVNLEKNNSGNIGGNGKGGNTGGKVGNNFINDYINYKKTGKTTDSLLDIYKEAFSNPNGPGSITNIDLARNEPFISISGGDLYGGTDTVLEGDIFIDFTEIRDGNFKDVVKVKNNRIDPFPGKSILNLMDWATRQIEEIKMKLTDFPTLFIILPDFSGMFNSDYKKYINDGIDKEQKNREDIKQKENKNINKKIKLYKDKISSTNCEKNPAKCRSYETIISNLENEKGLNNGKKYSGISEAYEFLSRVPFITIVPEQITVNYPYIDKSTLNKTLTDRKTTVAKRKKIEGGNNFNSNIGTLIASAERNIEILESYEDIPEKIGSLINKKHDRLQQLLCNVESISSITSGWISANGARFKAWVELFVVIKAILKSWQAIVDLFIQYDAECHECKNERYDLLGEQFSLVKYIIPKIPIFKFPRWPDIILDLHNIRTDIQVILPDFNFNPRPIVLPPLPSLNLPNPNGQLTLPTLNTLPLFEIPELPDLPSLPSIELPNLPPPPTLPKMFVKIEGIVDILKLVTKAMCILKKSPFVPEWRVGDQIAFLTERMGYMPFDFTDISLYPDLELNLPFVDAIKISSYVNLEFQSSFLTEIARKAVAPISEIPTNGNYILNGVPNTINVAPKLDKTFDYSIPNPETSFKNEEVTVDKFLTLINKEISKISFIRRPELKKIGDIWREVNKITYVKQDKQINKLLEENTKKFDILKAILNKELEKNNKLKQEYKNYNSNNFIKKVSDNSRNDIIAYNGLLDKYNKSFANAAINLIKGENKEEHELKSLGKEGFDKILNSISETKNSVKKSNLLVLNKATKNNLVKTSGNSCKQSNLSAYSYNYKGIYVLEGNTSYNLFDYKDELHGDEDIVPIDFDLDNDSDLLYSMQGNLYLKENYGNNNKKKYFSGDPLLLNASDNKFLNGDIFYEAVNNFRETISGNNIINLSFTSHSRDDINKYRVEYYTIIDKYLNENNKSDKIKKSIIDAYNSDDDYNLKDKEYLIKKNNSYISNVGLFSGVKLFTKEVLNISDSLKNGNIANLSSDTILYAGNKNFILKYRKSSYDDELRQIKVPKYSNIKFKDNIEIVGITGDAFKLTNNDIILEGQDIRKYRYMPLVSESKIEVENYNKLNESSHIDIRYADNTKLSLDLRDIKTYEVYDLGYKNKEYSINLRVPNDYLYSRIYAFKNNIDGTKTSQSLISPQKETDKIAPEINFNSAIRIPVYQKKLIDFTSYIYDNSGIDFIDNIKISGLDNSKYSSRNSKGKIRYEFGPFNKLFKKKITLSLTDNNGNKSSKDIDFEVYSPEPEIDNYKNGIISGRIDEKLTKEPINIYNYRGGRIKKLKTKLGEEKVYTDKGNFSFETGKNILGVSLNNNGKKIADINENTGKISLINKKLFNIKTKLDNKNYINIFVENNLGENIYYEKLIFSSNKSLKYSSDFDSIENNGVYFDVNSVGGYSYYKIPENALYNPGEIFIYNSKDIKKTPLLVIYKDGRVNFLNNNFDLKYDTLGEYIIIKIFYNNKEVAKILFKIKNIFLIR